MYVRACLREDVYVGVCSCMFACACVWFCMVVYV